MLMPSDLRPGTAVILVDVLVICDSCDVCKKDGILMAFFSVCSCTANSWALFPTVGTAGDDTVDGLILAPGRKEDPADGNRIANRDGV